MQCVCNAMCIMHLPFIFVGNAQTFNAPDIILECTFVPCIFSFLPECIKHFFFFNLSVIVATNSTFVLPYCKSEWASVCISVSTLK